MHEIWNDAEIVAVVDRVRARERFIYNETRLNATRVPRRPAGTHRQLGFASQPAPPIGYGWKGYEPRPDETWAIRPIDSADYAGL